MRFALDPGDLESDPGGSRFEFVDRSARELGAASPRGGLFRVTLGLRTIRGERYLTFRLRAYGNFGAATLRSMRTEVRVGRQVGTVMADWNAAPRRWYLEQRDF